MLSPLPYLDRCSRACLPNTYVLFLMNAIKRPDSNTDRLLHFMYSPIRVRIIHGLHRSHQSSLVPVIESVECNNSTSLSVPRRRAHHPCLTTDNLCQTVTNLSRQLWRISFKI